MAVRDEALRMLEGGKFRSGEEMAEALRMSRNAVWKAVEQLRRTGYEIEAVTNRGYRLVSPPEGLSAAEISRWLTTEHLGRELKIFGELDSTNNCAKRLAAAGASHGTVIIADFQSGGRGRRGRSFYSPRGSGIYLSCILRPDCRPERAAMLTSMAAVAAAEAVERLTDTAVFIKWVNDLYIGSKKICGILCEAGMDMESGCLDYAVVGIGVNVKRIDFPQELKDIASSVGNETGVVPDRNRLIAEILNRLEARYGELETGAFLEESRRRSNVIGREVTVTEGNRSYPARAVGIDGEGRLMIETSDGSAVLNYGEVSLKLSGKGTGR